MIGRMWRVQNPLRRFPVDPARDLYLVRSCHVQSRMAVQCGWIVGALIVLLPAMFTLLMIVKGLRIRLRHPGLEGFCSRS